MYSAMVDNSGRPTHKCETNTDGVKFGRDEGPSVPCGFEFILVNLVVVK